MLGFLQSPQQNTTTTKNSNSITEYDVNMVHAYRQWIYNARNGICRSYGFSVSSRMYDDFTRLTDQEALRLIEDKSPKLFKRLSKKKF